MAAKNCAIRVRSSERKGPRNFTGIDFLCHARRELGAEAAAGKVACSHLEPRAPVE